MACRKQVKERVSGATGRLQWYGRRRVEWILKKGLSLLSEHPHSICLLSFVFFNCQEADFWGKVSFTFLVAPRVRKLQQLASQVWAEVSQTLVLEKQAFLLKPSLGTLACNVVCLLSLRPGLFAKQRQHHHILRMLGANISSK